LLLLLPVLRQIFGWFLEPGELYDLQLDPQMPMELQLQQQQQQEQQQSEQQLPALSSQPQSAQQKQRKQKKRKQGAAADDHSIEAVQEGAAPSEGQKRSKAKKQRQRLAQQGLLQRQQPELAVARHTGPQVAAAAETEQSPGLAGKGAGSRTKHRQPQPKVPGKNKKAQKHKAVRSRKLL
jgi:hypothetical protein